MHSVQRGGWGPHILVALSEAPPASFPQLNTILLLSPCPRTGLPPALPLVPKEQVPPCSSASELRVGVPAPSGAQSGVHLGRQVLCKRDELPGICWGVAGKSPVGLQAQELGIPDVSPLEPTQTFLGDWPGYSGLLGSTLRNRQGAR